MIFRENPYLSLRRFRIEKITRPDRYEWLLDLSLLGNIYSN
jgi:hypothetical protein